MELLPDFTNTTLIVITIILWSLLFIQFFWLLFFYLRIAAHQDKKVDNPPPVSIIIAAKNEEDNLSQNLPFILEQAYFKYEVIVINHRSTDESYFILHALEKKYPHLRTIDVQKTNHLIHGKKLPLTLGVKGAKYEHLLFTDADCQPSSTLWLKSMAGKFSKKKELVLGYAPYRKSKGLLNRIIRLDTSFIALNYLSYAKAGAPYMGVGRNLAYTKSLFHSVNGFKSHYSVISGDDDLFIQEVAKGKNYTISLSQDTFCYSDAEKSWGNWRAQKARHYTTSKHYSLFKNLLLGIYPLTLLLLLISFFTLLAINGLCWITLGGIAALFISKWIILGISFKKLGEKGLGWSILFGDIFYALFVPIFYLTTDRSMKSKWK